MKKGKVAGVDVFVPVVDGNMQKKNFVGFLNRDELDQVVGFRYHRRAVYLKTFLSAVVAAGGQLSRPPNCKQ
jgi:hypothetical protein